MASDEQARPFLSSSRPSDEIELSHLDGPQDINNDNDNAQESDFRHNDPSSRKARPSPYLIALALFTTVLGFTINTEATAYFSDTLGWKKPFATLYITHSSLILPWLLSTTYSRLITHRHTPYTLWLRDYNNSLRETISTIPAYATTTPRLVWKKKGNVAGPLDYLASATALLTVVLTLSGISWFLALSLTTPADLTAIYNSSTFFAALFSIPLLHETLGRLTCIAVALSLIGTFVIAYGDTTAPHTPNEDVGTNRLAGNLVACAGAVAFGLYEVLFKKWAGATPSSPPHPASSSRAGAGTLPLTLAASALTGFYTLATLWIGLIALHITDLEPFVWPDMWTGVWIAVAVLSGSSKSLPSYTLSSLCPTDLFPFLVMLTLYPLVSITLLAILVVWTDAIFASFANILSVFCVALADWLVFGLAPSLATYAGGGLVIVAFGLLAWDTFSPSY